MKTKLLLVALVSTLSFSSLAHAGYSKEQKFFIEGFSYAKTMKERCGDEPYVEEMYSKILEVVRSGVVESSYVNEKERSEIILDATERAHRMPVEMCSGIAEMYVTSLPYYVEKIGYISFVKQK